MKLTIAEMNALHELLQSLQLETDDQELYEAIQKVLDLMKQV